MGRVVTGVVLRRNVWVGEAGPGRTLVAPSSCGKPAFGAWKRPGVCQREVFRDKLVSSSRVIDPVPSCFMLSPRLKHCGQGPDARAGSVAHGRGEGNNRNQARQLRMRQPTRLCAPTQWMRCHTSVWSPLPASKGGLGGSAAGALGPSSCPAGDHAVDEAAQFPCLGPGPARWRKAHWNLPADLRAAAVLPHAHGPGPPPPPGGGQGGAVGAHTLVTAREEGECTQRFGIPCAW